VTVAFTATYNTGVVAGQSVWHTKGLFFCLKHTRLPVVLQDFTALVFVTHDCRQGCQMVYFQTKNPNLGKFWRALEWKPLVYFYENMEYLMTICCNLWQFGIVCGHLVYFSQFVMFGPRKIWQP
jgi:hypothetical protein